MTNQMKSIIIGTAGHIDHGKTALVKALTGIDADRLEEEKRRGITIDLGFAHMDLPAGDAKNTGDILRLGFVDVPGHERFVRNMLAGVGGIDLVLLVIAADEAIKPQTREHFDILQLLGVQRGITVLTKSDAVDEETLEVVRLEVEDFLRGTFLEKSDSGNPDSSKPDSGKPSPIIAVSSLTGAGIEELKRAIASMGAEAPSRNSRAIARLPIDRVFTIKGFGTVVTGTLVAGTIHCEDELEVFPTGRRVRVRGLQVHGETAEAAVAGQRTALNLAGASTEDLSRGMTLAPASTFETTRRADVRLRLLPSAPRALKNRARIHFHSYTMESVAEVVLHGTRQISPGEQVFARIKLPQAVLLLPGDRFILRQFSPVVTIGGGIVLDAAPILRMPGHIEFLQALADGNPGNILKARIARRGGRGISMTQLIAETGWPRDVIQTHLESLTKSAEIVYVGPMLMQAAAFGALQTEIAKALEAFHKNNPLVGGISKEELRTHVRATPEVFEAVTAKMLREKKIEASGELVRLPGRGVTMKDEEAEAKKKIESAFAAAGLKVPALQEVLAGLKIDKARAQKIVTLLLRDKVLVKVSDDLVFHRGALEELRRQAAAYKATSAGTGVVKIDVAKFKDLTGVSRKYAIPLLEYLDRERVTRRVGDIREIL